MNLILAMIDPMQTFFPILVDNVFSHRVSREFTFSEFQSYTPKDWLPIVGALRHNDWFTKLTIENIKLAPETVEELCVVLRLNKTIKDVRFVNCTLKQDFCTRFAPYLPITHAENIDLSNNALEDKGLSTLTGVLQQRKLPLRSFNLQSCSLTHKSLSTFNTNLIANNCILKSLKVLNLSGNRVKDENGIAVLFSNSDNVLEELHLSDIEFNLDSFFNSLTSLSCKLRRLFITSVKSPTSTISGGVKLFFSKIQTLEVLQMSNANLSVDFLRELCDGLHSNGNLNNLDLRLSGNPLDPFLRDYASLFATIPCLVDLDISACDLENDVVNLLAELKKNYKLRSLHIGRNFNIGKSKNLPKIITGLKQLIIESKLDFLSLADAKLRDYSEEILLTIANNTTIKTLDFRGNSMGEAGVRALTHVLQMNRYLQTIYYDRNTLSLNNFEDIVNALEENYVIQYLPVPITDIILMRTSEKERMEKLQCLMIKLDSLCLRNQRQSQNLSSADSVLVATRANLGGNLAMSWISQQQLFGDQLSLEYIQSYSNRSAPKSDDVKSILARPGQINEISLQIYNLYNAEEERIKDEWNDMCKLFEQRLLKTQENLSKNFYRLFREQSLISSDDKVQEDLRKHISTFNNNLTQLLFNDTAAKLTTQTREYYVNIATSLQKRAYDTMNDGAIDMHRQLESSILRTASPTPQLSTKDGQGSGATSTLDRLVTRGAQVVHRFANRHPHPQQDSPDEATNNKPIKDADSSEYVAERSPKLPRSVSKENRGLGTNSSKGSTSPKTSQHAHNRRTVIVTSVEHEPDPTFKNYPVLNQTKKFDTSLDDEADRIQDEFLRIVEEEQLKDQQRDTPSTKNDLDIESQSPTKLVHLGKDRPRRDNVRRPVRRTGDGLPRDNSLERVLDTDNNTAGDISTTPNNEPSNPFSVPTVEPPVVDLPPKVAAKPKTAVKPLLTTITSDENSSSTAPNKNLNQAPTLQARSSSTLQKSAPPPVSSKPAMPLNNESPQIINSDPTQDPSATKASMSASSPATSNLTNKDDHKETYTSMDNLPSSAPPVVVPRTGRIALGTRVLPVIDPNGEVKPVQLRHHQSDKKANSSSTENTTGADTTTPSGDSSIIDDNEQYKRMSVKERALLLTKNITPTSSADKKNNNLTM